MLITWYLFLFRLHLRSTRPDQRLVYCGQLGVVERLLSHVGAISDEETNNLILDNYESFKVMIKLFKNWN